MTALTRDAIAAEARRWQSTPFRHGGRSAAGVDCVGFVIVVARALGIVAASFDVPAYPRNPDGTMPARMRAAGLVARGQAPLEIGRIVVFHFPPGRARHVGIVVDAIRGDVLHAVDGLGVSPMRLGQLGASAARLLMSFDFPMIEDAPA